MSKARDSKLNSPSTHSLRSFAQGIRRSTHFVRAASNGGEGGIRTRGTVRYTRFPSALIRPL